MNQQIDFNQEATDWLSGAFSRTETIERLVEMGCPEKEAKIIVDSHISQSWKKGLGELGLGLAIVGLLIGAFAIDEDGYLAGALSGILGKLFGISSIVLLADGTRRVGSLIFVTKVWSSR